MPNAPILDALRVGSRVYSTKASGVGRAGEPGIVYETYLLGGRRGVSIIFQGGGYDGFSEEDAAFMILPEGTVDPAAASYQFRNVGALFNDWRAEKFDFSAFEPYAEFLARSENAALLEETPPASAPAKPLAP